MILIDPVVISALSQEVSEMDMVENQLARHSYAENPIPRVRLTKWEKKRDEIKFVEMGFRFY